MRSFDVGGESRSRWRKPLGGAAPNGQSRKRRPIGAPGGGRHPVSWKSFSLRGAAMKAGPTAAGIGTRGESRLSCTASGDQRMHEAGPRPSGRGWSRPARTSVLAAQQAKARWGSRARERARELGRTADVGGRRRLSMKSSFELVSNGSCSTEADGELARGGSPPRVKRRREADRGGEVARSRMARGGHPSSEGAPGRHSADVLHGLCVKTA